MSNIKDSEKTEDSERVIIFDTTLRDGEQSPGASMNLDEKLRIASVLEEMGVDVIEAGFPIASDGDFEAVHQIAQTVTESVVCGLARATRGDIERCAEAIKPAKRGRIHTFISTSALHMKYKLQLDEVLKQQNVNVFMKRIELKQRQLDPVQTELGRTTRELESLREEIRHMEARAEQFREQLEMEQEDGQEVSPDEFAYMEREFGLNIRLLEERIANLDQKRIELEFDEADAREGILILEEMIDEALGLR